jgi:hypothetical protein
MLAGAVAVEAALPGWGVAAMMARSGGVIGAVAGVVTAGVKCFALRDRHTLTAVDAAKIFGRDVTAGAASGVAASAITIYVGAATATVSAVISAPAWVPPAVAVAAAIGVSYVVNEGCHEVWDRCIGS